MRYSAVLVAAYAGLISASPLHEKRQTTAGTSMMPAMTDGASTAVVVVPVPIPVPAPTMATSMAGSPLSMTNSAAPTTTSGMTTGDSNDTAASVLYPCPDGYLLTYVETQMNYEMSTDAVSAVVGDFQNATWMYYLNGTGGNEVGATRYLATASGAKSEVLSEYFTNEENVAVQLVMNLTSGPLMAPNGAVLSNYSTTLQVYQNTTASMGAMNVTTAKLFCNFCAADKATGMMAVLSNFQMSLMNVMSLLSGGEVPYPGPNGNQTNTMMTASMTDMPPAVMSSTMMSVPSTMMSVPSSMTSMSG